MIYHRGESFQARVTVPADLAEVDGLAVTAAIHAGAPRAPVVLAAAGEPGVFLLDLTPETVPPSPQGDYGVSIWATWPDGDRRRVGGFKLELRDGTPGGVTAARPGAGFDIPAIEVVEGIPGPSAYEVAQAEGFAGTRAEWLASLVGELSPSQAEALAAVVAEVTAARGGRSALGLRLDTVSSFASPNAGGFIQGAYFDNALHSPRAGTFAAAAGTVYLVPFFAAQALPVDWIGAAVTIAAAGGQLAFCVYVSGPDGWPDRLVYSSDPSDASATGASGGAIPGGFVFDAGRTYWLGIQASAAVTVRGVSSQAAVNLGLQSASSQDYRQYLARSVAFGRPLPDPWGFLASDLGGGNQSPPSIRMRAA